MEAKEASTQLTFLKSGKPTPPEVDHSRQPIMTSFSNKIDEWMKEAEALPESAVTMVH